MQVTPFLLLFSTLKSLFCLNFLSSVLNHTYQSMVGYWIKTRKVFEWLHSPSIKRKSRTGWFHCG